MKVYTVYEHDYDESMIRGVFSNEAVASMFIDALCMKYPKSYFDCNFQIQEWDLLSTIDTENL